MCQWLIADDALLKTISCDDMLAELADEKAYLRQTEQEEYRFHDLFRNFLLRMLKKDGEKKLLEQLSRAGDYYYGQKDYHRAAEYYKRGANDDGVINSVNQLYDYNCVGASIKDTLNTIRLVINQSTLEKDPFLFETMIWSAFVEGRADEFEEYADKYYELYPKIASQDNRSGTIFAFLFCIDYRLRLVKAFETISSFPQTGGKKPASPTLTHNMPFFHRSNRDFSELLHNPEANMVAAQNSIGVLIGKEYAVLQGCLFSGFCYERGQMSEAYKYALATCANITEESSPEVKFCAMMMLAAVLAAMDNTAELSEVIEKNEMMIAQKNAYYLSANLNAFKCGLRLANGDEAAAWEWLNGGVRDSFHQLSFFEIYQHFTTARAYITVGNYTGAALILKKLLALGERYKRLLDIIEAHILLAIVYWKKRQAASLDHIWQAASTAYEYGYTQPFENEGAELVNILHRLQKSIAQKKLADEVLHTFIRSLYIAATSGARRHKGLTGGRMPDGIQFTDKQKTVMRLMSNGLDRSEIAAKMDIKPYTVKSHMDLIYRKLDVSNRTDAIVKIRELGILSSGQK